jgi:phage gp36-like protein
LGFVGVFVAAKTARKNLMAVYATRADLDKKQWAGELAQLADRDMDGYEDDGVVDAAIAWSCALIDSKLTGRVDLSLSSPFPPRLVDIACDLTRYELYGVQPIEHVRQRYEDAIKQLDAVRDGKESLGLTTAGEEVGTVSTVIISSSANVFGNNMTEFY